MRSGMLVQHIPYVPNFGLDFQQGRDALQLSSTLYAIYQASFFDESPMQSMDQITLKNIRKV
jgi:hypothetical protein